MNLDLACRQELWRGDQVRPRGVSLDAKRNHMRVLEQEKQIGDPPGATLLDERALHVARDTIRNDAKAADFQFTHMYIVACRAVVAPESQLGNRNRALNPPKGDASRETDPP